MLTRDLLHDVAAKKLALRIVRRAAESWAGVKCTQYCIVLVLASERVAVDALNMRMNCQIVLEGFTPELLLVLLYARLRPRSCANADS